MKPFATSVCDVCPFSWCVEGASKLGIRPSGASGRNFGVVASLAREELREKCSDVALLAASFANITEPSSDMAASYVIVGANVAMRLGFPPGFGLGGTDGFRPLSWLKVLRCPREGVQGSLLNVRQDFRGPRR